MFFGDSPRTDGAAASPSPRARRAGGGGGGGGGGEGAALELGDGAGAAAAGADGTPLSFLVNPERRRVTCHTCGNLRTGMQSCGACPMVYCSRCLEKVGAVTPAGCFFCLGLCCCSGNRLTPSAVCTNARHCYAKCRVFKKAAPARAP